MFLLTSISAQITNSLTQQAIIMFTKPKNLLKYFFLSIKLMDENVYSRVILLTPNVSSGSRIILLPSFVKFMSDCCRKNIFLLLSEFWTSLHGINDAGATFQSSHNSVLTGNVVPYQSQGIISRPFWTQVLYIPAQVLGKMVCSK